MEKKKLNLATIEAAIKNEAIVVNENDKELACLILVDRVNRDKKESEHHSLLHGDANAIAAAIAMRMLEVEGFRDMIYKAVIAYEKTTEARLEKAFSGIDNALGKLIDNFEEIFGKKPSNKKRMRKQ